jgi:hypothetical protein
MRARACRALGIRPRLIARRPRHPAAGRACAAGYAARSASGLA